jgi:hypothetical protein
VKVEQQFSFAFLCKWICLIDMVFLISKFMLLLLIGGGAMAIAALAYSFYKTPEERRRTALEMAVSTSVLGRRVPCLNYALKSRMVGLWMADRQQPVQFAGIVVNNFNFPRTCSRAWVVFLYHLG